jgi:hypothetical protein
MGLPRPGPEGAGAGAGAITEPRKARSGPRPDAPSKIPLIMSSPEIG